MQKSGVYQILCKNNGHRYIGSAEDFDHRWATHKRELRRGKHHNKALQYAWVLFGETGFEFSVLEETKPEDLKAREDHYLDILKPEFNSMAKAGERSPGRSKKIPTCIRLESSTLSKLKEFAKAHEMSMTDIIESALSEYFKNHGFITRYILTASATAYVLVKQEGEHVTVLDQQVRNGIPIQTIRDTYAARYMSPVELLEEKDK